MYEPCNEKTAAATSKPYKLPSGTEKWKAQVEFVCLLLKWTRLRTHPPDKSLSIVQQVDSRAGLYRPASKIGRPQTASDALPDRNGGAIYKDEATTNFLLETKELKDGRKANVPILNPEDSKTKKLTM